MIDADQPFPSINSFNKVEQNKDGSIDLYFGPGAPAGKPASNWIKTNPGEGFVATVRLYGASMPFYDQSWISDDVVRLDRCSCRQDSHPMQTIASLGYLKDTGTPKGRGVFASRPITAGEVVELCPVIVLPPIKALPEALQNYVYCWSKLAMSPPSSALALGYGSMYNHDNPSNLRYEALPESGCIRFIAVRYIEAHEELTINYEAEGGGFKSALGNGWFEGAGITPGA